MSRTLTSVLPDRTVAVALREELTAAKGSGVVFSEAWPEAVEHCVMTVPSAERRTWEIAFRSTRRTWEDAYAGTGGGLGLLLVDS